MFIRLLKYREAVGDCRVPDRWTGDKQLASWVKTQRSMRLKGKLLPDRIVKLESVGFDWKPSLDVGLRIDSAWRRMFVRLVEYRKQFGNTLVPQGWKSDTSLADWVTGQRIANNSGRLSLERREKLNEAGFDWDPIATRWEEMFQHLIKFRDEWGHTNVPQGKPDLKELSTWVRNQRKAKSENQPIMVERAKRLDEIGFVWRVVQRDAWENDFEALVAFKREHGHCKVPQKGDQFRRLGKWVNTQRTFHKRGTLKPDRFQKLQEIGFVWNTKRKEQ